MSAGLRYEHWGGYPGAASVLEGFDAVRATDPQVQSLFTKLDKLDAAPRTLDGLTHAMVANCFTPEEVSRINSSLLDGLWKAVTGRDPNGQTPFRLDSAITANSFVCRLLCPRPYPSTLRWLAQKVVPGNPLAVPIVLENALILASSVGQVELLELLLPLRGKSKGHAEDRRPCDEMAMKRAMENGHLKVIQIWIAELGTPTSLLAEVCGAAAVYRQNHLVEWTIHAMRNRDVSTEHLDCILTAAAEEFCEPAFSLMLDYFPSRLSFEALTFAYHCVVMAQHQPLIEKFRKVLANVHRAPITRNFIKSSISDEDCPHSAIERLLAANVVPLPQTVRHALASTAMHNADLGKCLVLKRAGIITAAGTDQMLRDAAVQRAIRDADKELLEFALELGPINPVIQMPLYMAVCTNRRDLVELMVNAQTVGSQPRTERVMVPPDLIAVFRSYPRMTICDVHACLGVAAKFGNMAAMRFMFGQSDFTAAKAVKSQALKEAIDNRHTEIIELVLPCYREAKEPVPSDYIRDAVLAGCEPRVLKMLCNCEWSSLDDDMTCESLCLAAVQGRYDVCEVLLDKMDRHPKMVPAGVRKSFRRAMNADDRQIALLCSGLEYMMVNRFQDLMDTTMDEMMLEAVRRSQPHIVTFLFNYGSAVRYERNLAVRTAAKAGDVDMVELLLNAGGLTPFLMR